MTFLEVIITGYLDPFSKHLRKHPTIDYHANMDVTRFTSFQ